MATEPLKIEKTAAQEKLAGNDQIKRAGMTGAAVVGEFRGYTQDTVKYADPKTGKASEFDKGVCSFELLNGTQVQVEIGAPKGQKLEPLPYKKGDLVLFTCTYFSLSRKEGNHAKAIAHEPYNAS